MKLIFYLKFIQLEKLLKIIKSILFILICPYELLGYLSVIGNKIVKFIISKHVDNDYFGGSQTKKILRSHRLFL